MSHVFVVIIHQILKKQYPLNLHYLTSFDFLKSCYFNFTRRALYNLSCFAKIEFCKGEWDPFVITTKSLSFVFFNILFSKEGRSFLHLNHLLIIILNRFLSTMVCSLFNTTLRDRWSKFINCFSLICDNQLQRFLFCVIFNVP